MLQEIRWRDLPFLAGNRLFLDYIDGQSSALAYYTHAPTAYRDALAARRAHSYPRAQVAALLEGYNRRLGASPQSLANIDLLRQPDTFCIVGGQQAGFLGGPAYVAYKIACTIRLARDLTESLGVRVVPVFWLASEDHDFGEINHAHYVQADGEIGRVTFDWSGRGRPIADLSLTDQVQAAWESYWSSAQPGPYAERARALLAPGIGRYCDWLASFWLNLFADDGLIVVEPATLASTAGELFRKALSSRAEIAQSLQDVAERMKGDGYDPLLDPAANGALFTFGPGGQRVRVEDTSAALSEVASHPEYYSTDAALRPLLADSSLPVLASTLGAGELAYQGMLRPLYEMFGIPQPICFPRQSYTVISAEQHERLGRYGLEPASVLAAELDIDGTMRALMPAQDLQRFATAREGIAQSLAPLKDYVEGLDPNLGRSWEQTLTTAERNIQKLEERAINVTLSRGGYARRELQTLRNALVPRGRLQERELPVSHIMGQHGVEFVRQLSHLGAVDHFVHTLVTVENDGA